MAKPTIVIPEVPDFFKLGHPFPSMENLERVCVNVVAALTEFQRLEQKASSWAGKLEVHDPKLRAHNQVLYYAGIRIFYRQWGMLEKLIKTDLQEKIDELGLAISTVDCPNEWDVRDFRCNFPLAMSFRSDCVTAFFAIGEQIKGPAGPNSIVRVQQGEDSMKALDAVISQCCEPNTYRAWLQGRRTGRGWFVW